MKRVIGIKTKDRTNINLQTALDWWQNIARHQVNTKILNLANSKLILGVVYDKAISLIETDDIVLILDGKIIGNNKYLDINYILELYNTNKLLDNLANFEGGWSLVIYDKQNASLSLIRDRMGLKPFYWAKTPNGDICFASNAGALIKSNLVAAKDNANYVARYAGCHYRTIYGGEQSIFSEVKLLQPRTILSHNKQGNITKECYWDFNPTAEYLNLSSGEYEDLYRQNMQQMIAQYSFLYNQDNSAIALSGGIDSGTIIGLLHNNKNQKINAFSLTYDDDTMFDESECIAYSKRDHAGNYHDIKVDAKEFVADIANLYTNYDIPFATISIYGYDYLYNKASRFGYNNIFTGSGGDYIQNGNYETFLYNLADCYCESEDLYQAELNAWIKHHSTELYPKSDKTAKDFFAKHLNLNTKGELVRRTNELVSGIIANNKLDLSGEVVKNYGSFVRSFVVQEHFFEAVPPGTEAEDLIDFRYNTKMISPFFAKKVTDFGWSLPNSEKVQAGVNKVLARRALAGICAKEILAKIDKSGFNSPFDIWLRTILKPFAMDIFSSQKFRTRNIYDIKLFDKVLHEHMDETHNHMMFLWQALNIELWHNNWIDK